MIDKEKYKRLKRVFANQLPRDLKPSKKIKDMNSLIKDVLVLWRIFNYSFATLDDFLPYKYKVDYNINYQSTVKSLINRNLIFYNENGYLSISQEAQSLINYYNCIIVMDRHPEYELTFDMFESDPRWHIAPDNDIIWWNFNGRNTEYEHNHQWGKLKQNHINRAHLLFEEQKYKRSLEEFTTAAFLSTTGINDNDIVSPYEINNGYMNSRDIVLIPDETTKYLRRMRREKIITIEEIKNIYYNNQFINHYLEVLPFYYLDLDNSWLLLEQALLAKRCICFDMTEMLALRIKLKYNIPNPDSKDYFYNSLENQRKYQRYTNI